MNKVKKLSSIRESLKNQVASVGSWMQIPNSSVGEIMGRAGYDWIAIDLEHGSFSACGLPDIFRAIELGGALPIARVNESANNACKLALEAGAAGVILPNIDSAAQLDGIIQHCCWPPAGKRGVGYSRANLFGKDFEEYKILAQSPLIIAMIESYSGFQNLDEILKVRGLDAIFIGPYDLSASIGKVGQFDDVEFGSILTEILSKCKSYNVPCGIHLVHPNESQLKQYIREGYLFIANSIDSVFLFEAVQMPLIK